MKALANEFFQVTGAATDPLYERVKCPENRYCQKAHDLLGHMWAKCGQFIDKEARERAKLDFSAVWWELYLSYVLSELSFTLVPDNKKPHLGKGRPDIVTSSPRVWIEAVTPTAGEGADAISDPPMGKVYDVPVEGTMLRLLNAIQTKSSVVERYISDGTIPYGEPAIIAVSGARLPFRFTEGPIPTIVRSVYGIGNVCVEIDLSTKECVRPSLESKAQILKKSKSRVATDFFLREQSAHVSAILYNPADCVNHPPIPGQDFVLIHNPNALAPLGDDWMPSADQFWMQGDTVRRSASVLRAETNSE